MRFIIFFVSTLFWVAWLDAAVVLQPIINSGLEAPVLLTATPSDLQGLYVVDQPGQIFLYHGKKRTLVLDIRKEVQWSGEMGLLGFALHPEFGTRTKNGNRFFVNFVNEKDETVVREYDRGKKKDLLVFAQPYGNHNGGHLAFGPDGYLYIGVGDGGSAGDPKNAGQNKNTWLGKILRIDVNTESSYGIPADNPFAKGGGKPEIFAWGLRNPWRFSFGPKGRLFVGDVGQYAYEEISLVENGKNYGWRTMEAKHCFNPARKCDPTGLELPIHEYPRTEGQSVTGGYFYRGSAIKELKESYVFGDFGSGRIWALKQGTSGAWENRLLLKTSLPISSFGEDNRGELYVVALSGEVYKIQTK